MKQAPLLRVGFVVALRFDLEDGSSMFRQMVVDSRRLHGVISQKTKLPTQLYYCLTCFLEIKYMNKCLTRKGEKKQREMRNGVVMFWKRETQAKEKARMLCSTL
jgi:hypothetical protein